MIADEAKQPFLVLTKHQLLNPVIEETTFNQSLANQLKAREDLTFSARHMPLIFLSTMLSNYRQYYQNVRNSKSILL